MRKNYLTLTIIFLFLFISFSYAVTDCKIVAKKLHNLQNEIIEKSFRNLSPGSWADYGEIKAVYLGKKVSSHTGLKLRVVEFQGTPAGQLWFKLTSKDIEYKGKTYRFWTIEPMEGYIYVGGNVYYVPKAAIELFMRGKEWSIILFEGIILAPTECKERTSLSEKILTFPRGKKVKASVIESLENHSKLVCSPDVPFGMIRSIDSSGNVSSVSLKDFSFRGGKSKIPNEKIKKAQPFPLFGGSFPK